ncbi:MAG: tRNA (guanosine(46)-N7)-methyltransferase TrmB [Bacteroidales bacterium]|nr:tRNA (guanosine(46)-N7)-methyltransferase TrmB [Bacteroidales bacterium]
MGKNKLERFAENLTFENLFQVPYEQIKDEDFHLKGKWKEEYFKNNNPLVLELGCGKGEYTVGLARKYKDRNFIGIDIKGARLWRGCKTAVQENLSNVAFIRTHIQMLNSFFGKDEVDQIWITFCDPQPKNENRRLTCPRFLDLYSKVLAPNAVLHLKTDSKELFDYTYRTLQQQGHGILFATDDLYADTTTEDAEKIQTFYEKMFLDEGKKITYIRFTLNKEGK